MESPSGVLPKESYCPSAKRKYVEYAAGARELDDLDSDPHELVNRYAAGTIPSVVLASRLAELTGCVGDGCRALKNGQ